MKIEKKRWKIGNGSRKMSEKDVRTFFFFFFFFLLFTFENDENLFWVYQNGNFLPGKSISRREKNDFAPSEKYACYAPDVLCNKFGEFFTEKNTKIRDSIIACN